MAMANGSFRGQAEGDNLHILDNLEDARQAFTTQHAVLRPNFQELQNLHPQWADDLNTLTSDMSADDFYTVFQARVPSFNQAVKDLTAEDNQQTLLFITETLLDRLRSDSRNWMTLASVRDGDGKLLSHKILEQSIDAEWRSTGLNENLAYLLASVEGHVPGGLEDYRGFVKRVVDARAGLSLSQAGRLRACFYLLVNNQLREDVMHSSTFRHLLVSGFKARADVASMYYATLSLWMVTMNEAAMAAQGPLARHPSVLEAFLETFATVKKEKIVRAACLVLTNLVSKADWCFEILTNAKVENSLAVFEYEKWRDQELYDQIHALQNLLYQKTQSFSSFSCYIAELESSRLKPGPLHTEKFWIENVSKMEENEFKPIQILTSLLQRDDGPQDLQNVSLALYDLGEFARLHPTAKNLLTKIGAKQRMLELLNHHDKEISRAALLATQKIMLEDYKKVQ